MLCSKAIVPILIIASVLIISAGAGAQQAKEEDSVITITSDRMEVDNKNNIYIFLGNVVSKRAGYTIKSDRLEVYSKKDQEKVDKIIAIGNVKIDKDGRSASGDRAVYYEDQAKVVLTGNARAWEADNVVTGEEMTLYLNEDRSIVKGGKNGKVKAILYNRPKKDAQSQASGK